MIKRKVYRKILLNRELNKKMLAVLIDPDQYRDYTLIRLISALKTNTPDFVFVGGSLVSGSNISMIDLIKDEVETDVVLFPGNTTQFVPNADGILYLSLLSGRNPEYLIGQHVTSAIQIKLSDIEVIPTAYILVEGGKTSSVEYISASKPIPRDKVGIALSTATAGELLGMHLVYLEAGSGALHPVPTEMIQCVRMGISLPLIVGGGIKTTEDLMAAYDAGADLVVVGNAIEDDLSRINEFVEFTEQYNRQQEESKEEEI